MRYPDKCIRKAILLLNEVKDEICEKHTHKIISTLWIIIELLLRAIIFHYKHVTYDKPGKLISVLGRAILPIINIDDIIPRLNTLYDLRSRTVHRSDIMGSKELRKALMLFCHILNVLSDELRSLYPNIEEMLEDAEGLCHSKVIDSTRRNDTMRGSDIS